MGLTDRKLKSLEKRANKIRQDVIKMLLEAGSGHSAGPLDLADIFTALYFHVLKQNPHTPADPKRDRVFLSAGHVCPVWYMTLAHAGYLSRHEALTTLRKLGSRLQGHPHKKGLIPIENASGPLGQGISQAAGYALAAKMEGKKFETFCILGDGEQNEGQVWEAYMFAAANKLGNLTAIIDRNHIQIDGMTDDVMPLGQLRYKFEAFGWSVIDIDGHNMREIVDACERAKNAADTPVAIIAHTIPGKGVDFMEYKYEWHGKPPNKKEAKEALEDLRTLGKKIEGEHH